MAGQKLFDVQITNEEQTYNTTMAAGSIALTLQIMSVALNLSDRRDVNREISTASSARYTETVMYVDVVSRGPATCARGDIIMILNPRMSGANSAAVPFIMSVMLLSLLRMESRI